MGIRPVSLARGAVMQVCESSDCHNSIVTQPWSKFGRTWKLESVVSTPSCWETSTAVSKALVRGELRTSVSALLLSSFSSSEVSCFLHEHALSRLPRISTQRLVNLATTLPGEKSHLSTSLPLLESAVTQMATRRGHKTLTQPVQPDVCLSHAARSSEVEHSRRC